MGSSDAAAVSHPFDEFRETVRHLPQRAALQKLDEAQSDLQALRFELLAGELQTAVASAQPSPAVAAGIAVSQRLLDRLGEREDTRLLSASEMAGYVHKSRNWPADKARAGQLIRVEHAGKLYYPAFQIDPQSREAFPWVPDIVAILDELGTDGRSFAVWAATESERFDGELPALHTGDANFLPQAASALASE